jgi:hypothetical protein
MDGVGGHQADPGVAVLAVIQEKNWRQNALACSIESTLEGKAGRYFSVLKCASL